MYAALSNLSKLSSLVVSVIEIVSFKKSVIAGISSLNWLAYATIALNCCEATIALFSSLTFSPLSSYTNISILPVLMSLSSSALNINFICVFIIKGFSSAGVSIPKASK